MARRQLLYCLSIFSVWFSTFPMSCSQVYTSSQKVEDMVRQEEKLLKSLQAEIESLGNISTLSFFTEFHQRRTMKINVTNLHNSLKHPNAMYLTIKDFKDDYHELRKVLGAESTPNIQQYLSGIANYGDIFGAWRSFLRIQEVYNLSPMDMVNGDYLGIKGPSLSAVDAFEVGKMAFSRGNINSTLSWMDAAMSLKSNSVQGASIEAQDPSDAQIMALQGRSQIRLSHVDEAEALYEQARYLEPLSEDVEALRQELESKPKIQGPGLSVSGDNFTRLCSAHRKIASGKLEPWLNCSYRTTGLPYYRFKQELLSISPYVCLIYDVVTDTENQYIKNFATAKLTRSLVEKEYGSASNEGRISDHSFVWDYESKVFAGLSKRVGDITYLETAQTVPKGLLYSSEAFQVLNYGMGGLYIPHVDTFQESVHKKTTDAMEKNGNRLATFLIYLSDVERGGATAFSKADIAVHPVKNMALFWYNFNPAGEVDANTMHAGCPVVVGHKWVTNKWLWTFGNTFTRRCGLTEDATQLDIEEHMRRRWT